MKTIRISAREMDEFLGTSVAGGEGLDVLWDNVTMTWLVVVGASSKELADVQNDATLSVLDLP